MSNFPSDVLKLNTIREADPIIAALQGQGFDLYWDYFDRDGDEWEYAIHEGKRVQCGKSYLFAKKKKLAPHDTDKPSLVSSDIGEVGEKVVDIAISEETVEEHSQEPAKKPAKKK